MTTPNIYSPRLWAIVRFEWDPGEVYYKILADFGDTWKLSTAIDHCELRDWRRFAFKCESGATYMCHPDDYGLTLLTAELLGNLETNANAQGTTVVALGKDVNFLNMDYQK